MAAAGPIPSIVGALSCQKDSYLRTLQTEVVSCTEYTPAPTSGKSKGKKSKGSVEGAENVTSAAEKTWLIEMADSVLFPEGGGQPTDQGTITALLTNSSNEPDPEAKPIPITKLERHGLRCMHFSPIPLVPGTPILQTVDYTRRWDHMQQHTGQHLLSAIMDTLSLETLSWSMGGAGEMNYLEIPRKPSPQELESIQRQCNEAIRANYPITVETPSSGGKTDSLPEDYDKEKGIVRFIKIGDLDYNACCGTHLKQTSHIGLILLHHMQTVRGTNCRLFFSAGDRAIALAANSINSLRSIAISLSSGSAPEDVQASVQRLGDALADTKKREKKLLAEIAKYEGDRIKNDLKNGKVGWCHRAGDGLDFIMLVVGEVKDAVKEHGVVVLVTGEVRTPGSIMIIGQKDLVESIATKAKAIVDVKGGGKDKWQGKVVEWKKGEIDALKEAIQSVQ